MNRRVLVTGAGGFIGRQCLGPMVAAGCDVHAVSRGTGVPMAGVRWHGADLFDAAAVETLVKSIAPTHLLQLAWDTTPGKYWTSFDNLVWVRASLFLAESFVRHGGRRMVTAGTCAEYDWRFGWCSEGVTPSVPATLYGSSKQALQLALAAFAAQAGVSAAWGRVFFVYGPGEHPARVIPYVARSILAGEPARCSSGEHVRDFLHVEDAGRAFAALLDSDVAGIVNIASGRGAAVRDVATEVANLLGRRDLLDFGAPVSAANEPPLLVADVRRLTAEVGWTPKYTLAEGLASAVEWWREQGGLPVR